jgi:hypothetical protein
MASGRPKGSTSEVGFLGLRKRDCLRGVAHILGDVSAVGKRRSEAYSIPPACLFRHAHGGTDCGSIHKPRRLAMGPLPIELSDYPSRTMILP